MISAEPSSQSSGDDSQPSIAEQGDQTSSPRPSEDSFEPLSDTMEEKDSLLDGGRQSVAEQGDRTLSPRISAGSFEPDDSLYDGDQQREDAQQQVQAPGERLQYPHLRQNHQVHVAQRDALGHHPELRISSPQSSGAF
jgi:hypothetical protein